jgi:hypothetical protein
MLFLSLSEKFLGFVFFVGRQRFDAHQVNFLFVGAQDFDRKPATRERFADFRDVADFARD